MQDDIACGEGKVCEGEESWKGIAFAFVMLHNGIVLVCIDFCRFEQMWVIFAKICITLYHCMLDLYRFIQGVIKD